MRILKAWLLAVGAVTLAGSVSWGCFIVPECTGCSDAPTGGGGAGGTSHTTTSGTCTTDADCEDADDKNPCTRTVCSNGHCAHEPDDSLTPKGDGNPCTTDSCVNGKEVNPYNSEPCGTNPPTTHCENGVCIGCKKDGDCPEETACQSWACLAGGECLSKKGPTSKFVDPLGDCRTWSCDANGQLIDELSQSDAPDDGKDCTANLCNANFVPVYPPAGSGTACNSDGGMVCDSAGNCVQCNVASDCPQPLNSCVSTVCSAGVCVLENVANQTSCDGANGQCNEQGQCLHHPGFPCGDDATLCASGYCTNGVCCPTPCAGDCQSCALGKKGECIDVPFGAQGNCDSPKRCEFGVCTFGNKTAVGDSCGSCTTPLTCTNNTCQKPDSYGCSGPDGAWVCVGNSCKNNGENFVCQPCVGGDCGPGGACNGGICSLGNGASCGGTADCASGNCVDGVCCDTPCGGPCMHCALPATLGICSFIPAGVNLNNECGATQVCDGAGNCQQPQP